MSQCNMAMLHSNRALIRGITTRAKTLVFKPEIESMVR
jgi:hypothetical protein